MTEVAQEMTEDGVEPPESAKPLPPVRRGSREERREASLQSFGAGKEARCAYCGRTLPPIPPRGGRPTPYCPADPERYGRWGARVITCALLDECREIWVHTYGADQPMTRVDLRTLDERTATVLDALEPVRQEIAALRTRVSDEAAAALEEKSAAEVARDAAIERAREAEAERVKAAEEAGQARRQAEEDRARAVEAQERAALAVREKDEALARQQAAEREKTKAIVDRERALDQVTTAHEKIAELQTALTGERATTLERLDQLRHEEARARQNLTEEYEQRLRARTEEFNGQARSLQAAADQRVAELTTRLARATQAYADALAPLHEQIGKLRADLTTQTAHAADLARQREDLNSALGQALDETTEEQPLRGRLAAMLGRQSVDPGGGDTGVE
ncbi:hypothetical protein [Amycolatopsis rhizosphaerae]|uniref:hypothetical protein n=1 Tax=Amycolatopsis rhizosphaerae TaxID=2053003 RepID=UPI001FE8891F|nr:hypothetical protein [Amycolatopsis rhizosphaerae]